MKLPIVNRSEKEPEDFPPIASFGKADPIYAEQIKSLRAKFEYRIDKLKLQVIAVTSTVAGEGKTTSCAKLAIHLALAGRKKVLLLDTDMRKSDLARILRIRPYPGLKDYLDGMASAKDILRNSFQAGLYVIPAGTRAVEPADLLAGERFRTFLGDIRNSFDVILLDTPPILPVADTLSLRDLVDGFIFVYRAGSTPYPMMRQAVEDVGEKKIIGVVLNGIMPHSQKYYQRYYGKYYRKTTEEETTA